MRSYSILRVRQGGICTCIVVLYWLLLLCCTIMLYDDIVLYVVAFLQQGRMAMPIVGRLNYQSIKSVTQAITSLKHFLI